MDIITERRYMANKYYDVNIKSVSRYVDKDGEDKSEVFDFHTETFQTIEDVRAFIKGRYYPNKTYPLAASYIYREVKDSKPKIVGIVYSWNERDTYGDPYIWEDWVDVQEIKAMMISPESWGEVNDVEVDL
jgi:hypothetical protein